MMIIDKNGNITNYSKYTVTDLAIVESNTDKLSYLSCRLINGTSYGLGSYSSRKDAEKGINKIIKGYRFFRRVVKL